MTDISGSDSTTGTESLGRTGLLTYLIVVIIFPALFSVFLLGWSLWMRLLLAIHLPVILVKGVWLVGVLSSLVGSFLCCRKIWRGRPTMARPNVRMNGA